MRLLIQCLVLFNFIFGSIVAQVPLYVPTNGLVGWWGFNGNANDASGNGNNGNVNGATLSVDRFGINSSAYSFDGIDDFIQLQCPVVSNAITISLWAYDHGGYPNSYSISPRYVSAEFCDGSFALLNNVNVPLDGLFFTRKRGTQSADIKSNSMPSYNIYQHIVFTYNGSIGKFYINGNLVSSVGNAGIISTSSYLYFGKSGCPFGQMVDAFKGQLDDIGIWNRALSDVEITALYQASAPLTATAQTVSNVSCYNGSNGITKVTPFGGFPPYTYSWNSNPIQTTQNATNLKAGTYTVTVLDSKGSSTISTATVVQPTAITNVNATTISNVSCLGGNDGIVSVTSPSGGIPPYTYTWNTNPIQTTQIATNLKAGNYIITVTDFNGCITSSNVTVTEPPSISNVVASPINNVGCFGGNNGSATVTNPTGGTPPYTYQWNTNPLQVTQTANNLLAGTYLVTVTDSKGCTATSSVTITQPAQPLSNVIGQTIQHAKCNGSSTGSVTVSNPIGGTPPYTYKWNSVPEQKTQIATNLSAGTYTVTVTDFNGCTATSFATVNEPTKVTNVQASVLKNISCYGLSDGSAKVSDPRGGTPPYTYQWNTVPVQNNQIATNLKAGEYEVVVSDANGCITQSLISVTQPNAPLAIGNAKVDKQVSCFSESDGAVTVPNPTGGTAPYSIVWNTNPIQKTYSISNLKAGTYTAIITDANGCSVSTSATVTEPSQVVVFSPKDTTVLIQTVAFMKAGSNNPISTYNWQTNTGTGYSNLQNVFQYSGVTTNTLRIENCTTSNHNQPFRCIISTNGCLDTSAIAVLAVRTNVSVKGDYQKLRLTISPNPICESDQFLVRFTEIPNQDISIELLDILGSVHYSNTLQAESESCSIPVQGLSSGMYMLRVRINSEQFMEKLIIN